MRYTDKPRVASYVVTQSHYVAYFEEDNKWYLADDSRIVPLGQMPDAFPNICFFERVGMEKLLLTPLPPNPLRTPQDSVDFDAVDLSSEGSAGEQLGGREDGPQAKRKRLWGKQPPPTSYKSATGKKRAREQDGRDRTGRKQSRCGRQDERGRSGRGQNRSGRRTLQQRQDALKRVRTRGPANDNLDGSRKDVGADRDDPVSRFIEHMEDKAQGSRR